MSQPRKSPSTTPTAGEGTPTDASQAGKLMPDSVSNLMSRAFGDDTSIGSPLKKQRASVDAAPQDRSANFPSAIGDVLGRATAATTSTNAQPKTENPPPYDEDEEL